MIHNQKSFAPFGDDEDANCAVRSFAKVAGMLAQETQKLATMRTPNLNLRAVQETRVADLRAEIESRARAVHVDADDFLDACLKQLARSGVRPVTKIPALARPPIDDEDRRLQGEVCDAEITEANRKRLLEGAQERYAAAEKVAEAARAALAAHRANQRAAA